MKWPWQTAIISSIHSRMQKIGMIKRVVTEDEVFFRNLPISICSSIVVTDNRKKIRKNHNF